MRAQQGRRKDGQCIMKGKKHKPVSSGSGMIPKASMAMGKATMKMGGMGGQHLKHTPAGSCPKLSKLD